MKAAVRRLSASLALVAALIAIGGSVLAATVTGSSGLVTLPTADVLPAGAFEVGGRYVDERLGLTAAFGAYGDLEVGVNTLEDGTGALDLGVFLKGVLLHESASSPGIAVGYESGHGYIVASKRVAPRVRLHAAYLFGDDPGPAAGVAYSVSTASVTSSGVPRPATTLIAEYTPEGLNAGARLLVGTAATLDMGLIDLKHPTAGLTLRLAF